MIKNSGIESTVIQKRIAQARLREDPRTNTISTTDGSQCYFRSRENGKDIYVRHDVHLGRYRVLNKECDTFVLSPRTYFPDMSRPFTENDLIRDLTWMEAGWKVMVDNAPGSVAGTVAATAAGIGLVALTPIGTVALAGASTVGLKIVVGLKALGAAVATNPGNTVLIGCAVGGMAAIIHADETDASRRTNASEQH